MEPLIGPREAVLIVSGTLIVLGSGFVAARIMRSLRHGFSIRLQLFLAISGVSLLTTAVIGIWVVDRLQMEAAQLVVQYGPSVTAVVEFLRAFAPRTALLVALLGASVALSALTLGRAMATPLEDVARYAEAVARGERAPVLPAPIGREVRRLTAAFEHMRRSLEDRHAIERFVADLSHELKNPVSAIRAATEVLLDGAAEDPEVRPRFLARIDEASHRLEMLLQDLLALARLEAHGASDLVLVQLDDVVRGAVEGHADGLESNRLQADLDLQPVRIRGDAVWLRRAIDNLLSNAIRYSPEGSRITMRLRSVEPEALLTVRDYGPGVDPRYRDRLFERFFTDRTRADGTGLGLSIVRSVAEQHGGSARLVDHEGPGACFELRLHLGSPAPPP